MVPTASASCARPSGFGRRLSAGVQGLARLSAKVIASAAHRRDVTRMLEMDDRALKDIGLVRSDVQGALAEPFPNDPADALRRRSVENRLRQRSMEASLRRVA